MYFLDYIDVVYHIVCDLNNEDFSMILRWNEYAAAWTMTIGQAASTCFFIIVLVSWSQTTNRNSNKLLLCSVGVRK